MSVKTAARNGRAYAINKTTAKVNLAAFPTLPFEGALLDIQPSKTPVWVTLERRPNGLYVDGVKGILHVEVGQKRDGGMEGDKLREALATRTSVHPNVIDAAVQFGLMPDELGTDKDGTPVNIFSFGVVFRRRHRFHTDDRLCVRYWGLQEGEWLSDHYFLDNFFEAESPSFLLEKAR